MMHVFISLFTLTIIGESMLTAHERCGNDFIFERNLHACCNNIKYSIDVQSCCNGIIMAGACPGNEVVANDVRELPISNGPRVIIRSDYVYPVTDNIEAPGVAVGNNENPVENADTDKVLIEEKIKNEIEADIEAEVEAEVEMEVEAELTEEDTKDDATKDDADATDETGGADETDGDEADETDETDETDEADGTDGDGDDEDEDGDDEDGVEKIRTTEDATDKDDSSSSDDSSSDEAIDGQETGDQDDLDEFGRSLSEREGSHSSQHGNNNESLNGNMDYYVKITLINMWLILGLIVIVNVIFYWCYCRKNNRKNKLPSISSNNMFVDNHDHQTAGQLTDDEQV